jgi:glutaminyl-tRNA synthetase
MQQAEQEVMDAPESRHFIQQVIDDDIASSKFEGRVVTRFPPEPNGYLQVGHAKAICIDFGLAREYGGICHLRFDDTDPEGEEQEFVEAIKEDIRWLGFDWGEHEYYASDYYEQLYDFAVQLITHGKAYVCALDMEAFKEYRGVPTRPGMESPSRERPVEESLDLFARMRAGEFEEGDYVLRARIDMSSPNLHMRDPVVYRIKKASHYRTGDTWCIYPMYDFTHCLSDSMEGVTHSLCTLEFEVHRPLYNWYLEALGVFHSEQTEFAPLSLSYTVTSKRKIRELVEGGFVEGWDDPRLPTLRGLRRRGYTPASIREFCDRVGVTKYEGLTDVALLEHCIRDDLNRTAPRRMAVLKPLKVVIENYPEGESETFEAVNNPEDSDAGTRQVPFSREIYVEREDFMEDPPKKFYRLSPGREVRLRAACLVTCTDVIKDPDSGEITEVRCTFDPESRGGKSPDGRKVKSTLHWVSASHAVEIEVRLYDRLFTEEDPGADKDGDFKDSLNKDSKELVKAYGEPALAEAAPGTQLQFERIGYFCADRVDSTAEAPVFNRTVTLRDTWAKAQKK